jgi:hypothetical protein
MVVKYLIYIVMLLLKKERNIEAQVLRFGGFALLTGVAPATRGTSTRLVVRTATARSTRTVWCQPAEFLVQPNNNFTEG